MAEEVSKAIAAAAALAANDTAPATLFDYRGERPDAFSAFLDELLHLSRTKLPRLDRAAKGAAKEGGGRKPLAGKRGGRGGAKLSSSGTRPPLCDAVPSWLPGHQKSGVLGGLCRDP